MKKPSRFVNGHGLLLVKFPINLILTVSASKIRKYIQKWALRTNTENNYLISIIYNIKYIYPVKVYINQTQFFEVENPEPKGYSNTLGYFSAPIMDPAVMKIRNFVHSAKLEKIGFSYNWNCTDHGADFGDGNQCEGITCGSWVRNFNDFCFYYIVRMSYINVS